MTWSFYFLTVQESVPWMDSLARKVHFPRYHATSAVYSTNVFCLCLIVDMRTTAEKRKRKLEDCQLVWWDVVKYLQEVLGRTQSALPKNEISWHITKLLCSWPWPQKIINMFPNYWSNWGLQPCSKDCICSCRYSYLHGELLWSIYYYWW